MSRFGKLWIGDFMHGPQVLAAATVDGKNPRHKKAILMAIIDDHSRMIVGASFGFQENTLLLENVFKDAILTYGLPDRLYVDNGASFSSIYLKNVCAHLKIGLVHSKPYDSPSRSNDCVISLHAKHYEVPPAYVGRRVELKYLQDRPLEIYLYDEGVRIQRLHFVDTQANGRTYRPGPRDPHVPFQTLINSDSEVTS